MLHRIAHEFHAAVQVEVACQIYSIFLFRGFDEIKSQPDHYYQSSINPTLGYELKSPFSLVKDNKMLYINQYGIREQEESIIDNKRIIIP